MSNSNGNLFNFLMSNGKNHPPPKISPASIKSKDNVTTPKKNKNNKAKKSTPGKKSKLSKAYEMSKVEKLNSLVVDEISFDSFMQSYLTEEKADCEEKVLTITCEEQAHLESTITSEENVPELRNDKTSPNKSHLNSKPLDYLSRFRYVPSDDDSISNGSLSVTNEIIDVEKLSDKVNSNANSINKICLSKSPSMKHDNKCSKKLHKDINQNIQSVKNSFDMGSWCGLKQKKSDLVEIEFQQSEEIVEIIEDDVCDAEDDKSDILSLVRDSDELPENSDSFNTEPMTDSEPKESSNLRRSLRKRVQVEYTKVHIFGDVPLVRRRSKTSDKIPPIFDPTTWKKGEEDRKVKRRYSRKNRIEESEPRGGGKDVEDDCILVEDERPVMDPEKRNFLMSGLPQILRKPLTSARESTEQRQLDATFPKFNHIFNVNPDDEVWLSNLPSLSIPARETSFDIQTTGESEFDFSFLKEEDRIVEKIPFRTASPELRDEHIETIKSYNSTFPIKRYLKTLIERYNHFDYSKRLANDDEQNDEKSESEINYNLWSEKYSPLNSLAYLGNSNRVLKVKDWLKKWRIKTDRESRRLARQLAKDRRKNKKVQPAVEDNSDDDFRLSDCESEQSDADNDISQTMLITGPHGVGKTVLATALANELDYKVFEVNASSKRSGKEILQQLLAAVESQHVSKDNLSTVFTTFEMTKNFQATQSSVRGEPPNRKRKSTAEFFTPKSKKAKLTALSSDVTPQTNKQDDEVNLVKKGLNLKCCSVVLFDEVDLVFDEDKGFWSAISTFMQLNKRPIIMTSTDSSFLDKFGMQEQIEQCHLVNPSPAYLASYLATACLIEGYLVHPRYLEQLAYRYNSDLRKCLNSLQLYLNHCRDENIGFTLPLNLSISDSPLIGCHTRLGYEFGRKLMIIKGKRRKLNCKAADPIIQPPTSDKNCSLTDVFDSEADVPHGDSNDVQSDVHKCNSEEEKDSKDESVVDDPGCDAALHLLSSYYDSVSMLDIAGIDPRPINSRITASCMVDEPTDLRDNLPDHGSTQLRLDLGVCWSTCWKNQFSIKESEIELPDRFDSASPTELWRLEMNQRLDTSTNCRHQENILKSLPHNLSVQKCLFTMDYLPTMRQIANIEEFKKLSSRKRRYFHYFDKISLHIKESALQYLKQELPSSTHNSDI